MFQIGLALMRTCTLHTFIGLWSSIITLFRCQNRSVIANHSIQFARKSVIANIISIWTSPSRSAQLNRPNVGCKRTHALEWTSTWLLFAQSYAEFQWFWLIGRRIGTVLYSFWSNFVFFFYFSSLTLVRHDCENHERFLVGGLKLFFYYITCYYEVIYSSAMENWVHSKEFRWCLGVKKRARTHTIRDVVWSNVMLRIYHSFFVVSIPFQAIAYLYISQMKVDIFRSAIVGFNLTWSVAAVFFSPSYFSDIFAGVCF